MENREAEYKLINSKLQMKHSSWTQRAVWNKLLAKKKGQQWTVNWLAQWAMLNSSLTKNLSGKEKEKKKKDQWTVNWQ